MFDFAALGEVVIDFTQIESETNKMQLLGSAGGAPGNVLVQGSKLGAKTAFVGAVGNDVFGKFLKKEIEKYNIDTSAMVMTKEATTTLAIVYFDEEGDRSFDFVRAPGADSKMSFTDDARRVLDETDVIVYPSLAFSKDPTNATVLEILETYKGKKVLAYDPNLRPKIWNNDSLMREKALVGLKYASVLKLGDDEATFIMEKDSVDSAVKAIQDKFGIELICVTMGKYGCKYYLGDRCGEKPSYAVKTLDTTGAGDSFFGTLLWKLSQCHYKPTFEELGDAVAFANAAGAYSTTHKGSMDAMGYLEDIEKFIKEYGK